MEEAVAKDSLNASERVGQAIAIVGMVLWVAFFIFNQLTSTGFFTEKFGILEMLLFYASPALGGLAAASRAAVGRKNTVRPLDVLSAIATTIASFWLLVVFPFDYSHLTDAIPTPLRFLLSWMTNDIGKVLLVFSGFASAINAVYTAAIYVYVKRRMSTKAVDVFKIFQSKEISHPLNLANK